MKFTVIVCCVFCSTARHHTPLYVLDSWSCFLKKKKNLVANGFARQVTHLENLSQELRKCGTMGKI